MSVRCISKVLEESAHAGTALLMLVVLADYSDDEGNSYPSVASLARKCRMTGRNAGYILNALQASGEVRVLRNEGPRGTNRYRIVLSALGRHPLKAPSPLKGAAPLKTSSPNAHEAGFIPEEPFTPKPNSGNLEAGFLEPLKPTADEPSLNRQEPSYTSVAAQPRRKRNAVGSIPTCPKHAIVDLYHEVLPELPRVKFMTKDRERSIPKFWRWVITSTKSDGSRRAVDTAEALEWFRGYFGRTRDNDFLMGRTTRGASHEGWRCDFDFLMSERGMKQVIEKTGEAA